MIDALFHPDRRATGGSLIMGYTRSALYPLARYINQTLAIWLKRKYKRFHHRLGRARLFLEKIAREKRRLFVHWQLGDGGKLA
ncbi:hypothetical protein ACVIHI_004015 [Bradyrhizobium sp. USDA 4524]|uniref:hypothetical protein n=1 Tax=unclassified Bradyrhizobium TaxID=2631580 RepID=UPI0020A17FE3|nr:MULTISPECIES: hypothetical protein [unclassified Bradyrhizobium]MCP1843065.1 hypothetical protein [Bradyrhizobium sp. USDA 4538]MCP1903631.1 hypothetical protein [Bradyrhizobium sp. USDA 4537]MCP1990712.1 hypothetical protein [Bradyrhizobium sp. USDA 4539]